jgi:hypothetical protein
MNHRTLNHNQFAELDAHNFLAWREERRVTRNLTLHMTG